MKIIVIALLSALPISLSAQSVTDTLEMVQNLSVSAGSSSSLELTRENSTKPFSVAVPLQAAAVTLPAPVENPGKPAPAAHLNPAAHPDNPGNHGGNHYNPPVVVVNPPAQHHPGCNDPHNPGHQNPGHYEPEHYNPGYHYPDHHNSGDAIGVIMIITAIAAAVMWLISLFCR